LEDKTSHNKKLAIENKQSMITISSFRIAGCSQLTGW